MEKKGWKISKMIFLSGFLFLMIPALCYAQQYPTKPINILINKAPGGTLDIPTRIVASKAEKFLGQPFILSNNGGGGGSVALGIIAKEKPDGYHLVATSSSTLIRVPQFRTVTYKLEDFDPIMYFAAPQTGLAVRADSPWKTLKEFVEYAKKNPRKVTYATSGAGSAMHLAMEYIAKQEGIEWIHVPYPGEAPALTALLGGHVTAVSDSTGWVPHVQQGTLRLLCTHGERRMKTFPDVPILLELGYNYFNEVVFLFVAPKGTPPSIVKKLDEAFHKAMDDPEFIQTMAKFEIEVAYRNSADTKKYLEDAYVSIGKMITELKIPKEEEK